MRFKRSKKLPAEEQHYNRYNYCPFKIKLIAEYVLNSAIEMKKSPDTNENNFKNTWFRTFFALLMIYNRGTNQHNTPIIMNTIEKIP